MAEHHDILWAIFADKKTSSTAKCAAAALLLKFYNPGTGRCDPSFTTLGKVIGRSRRSAIKSVDELKAGDNPWLVVESTKGGSQANTNSFRFRSPTGVNLDTGAKDDTGAGNDVTSVRSCTGPVSDPAHELSIELSKNHEGGRRTRAKRLPSDFGLDRETQEWAESKLGSSEAVYHSMFRFTNHYRQAAGSRGLSTDWMAKARLWIDDDAAKQGPGKSVVCASTAPSLTHDQWDALLASYVRTGRWTRHVDQCGSEPPSPDCRAPRHLLIKHGILKEDAA